MSRDGEPAALTVGQEVVVYEPGGANRYVATVEKVARVYATLRWGDAWYSTGEFRMDDGDERGSGKSNYVRYFRTKEEAAADDDLSDAREYLRSVKVDLEWRNTFTPEQIIGLAAYVRTMLAADPLTTGVE